jgi:hypothetical protein
VSNAKPGQKLTFDISGEGMLQQAQDQQASSGGAAGDTRPGGGLGAPIDAPDPLDKYRGYILGGFAVILVGGALFIMKRARSVRVTGATDTSPAPKAAFPAAASVAASASPSPAAASGAGHASMLLQGLKEELFQLELEHKQGKISDQEYATTKAALDQTLARAIKRTN